MKNCRSFANHLLCFLFLSAFALAAFAAEPAVPTRNSDDARISTLSDQKPSSLLVFNLYTSASVDADKQDTSFSITNVNVSQPALVHLFFVGGNCTVADTVICLTPNQTAKFLASEVDPGVTGYVLALATDRAGCPSSFNYLIGSEYVKLESGHAANLAAEGYSALFNGTLPGCSATSTLATVPLDGVRYNAAARVLAVDRISSLADGNQTLLIVNSLEGNLAIGMQPIRDIEGTVFDDAEIGLQFTGTASCQLNTVLSNNLPRITPRFENLIPAGRTGWMRLMAKQDVAISGAVINFNADAATKKNCFNGGHNLHPLRFTSGSLIIPVFDPNC